MSFLIDQQLPPMLVDWFDAQGCKADHVRNIGLRDAADNEIWEVAARRGLIIVTKDEDFAQRRSSVATGPSIVWLRLGNATNEALLAWLEPRWADVEAALKDGAALVEVR